LRACRYGYTLLHVLYQFELKYSVIVSLLADLRDVATVYEGTKFVLLGCFLNQLTQQGRRDRCLVISRCLIFISCLRVSPLNVGWQTAEIAKFIATKHPQRRGLILDALVFELVKKPSTRIKKRTCPCHRDDGVPAKPLSYVDYSLGHGMHAINI
jgi:hypothetical protein